jgi:chromosomal replication initiation ATPase DnaA
MSEVKYAVLQKPLLERILDAACIYWEFERESIAQKAMVRENAEKFHILYYILRYEADASIASIGRMFSKERSSVFEAIENINVRKNVSLTIAHTIRDILALASNLDAEMITVTVQLHPRKQ